MSFLLIAFTVHVLPSWLQLSSLQASLQSLLLSHVCLLRLSVCGNSSQSLDRRLLKLARWYPLLAAVVCSVALAADWDVHKPPQTWPPISCLACCCVPADFHSLRLLTDLLAQAVSSRPDVTPPSYTKELEKLQDQIPPFNDVDAMRVITEELGMPPSSIFSSISPSPIAAASLGQVGQLSAGLHAAVLVQLMHQGHESMSCARQAPFIVG